MQFTVAIGLGSNVGDRLQAMQQAVWHCADFLEGIKKSSLYESPALLPKGAPKDWDVPFYNAVIKGCTLLPPLELLKALQAIEQRMGRVKEGVWSPRVIDLDLILYGNELRAGPELTLPHAEMAKRDFVLLPLAELMPYWQHPQRNISVTHMLAELNQTAKKRLDKW
jgi:2-amino-4-hydroxy-6-hydroxymethyldihydropteridine diphosphokinase